VPAHAHRCGDLLGEPQKRLRRRRARIAPDDGLPLVPGLPHARLDRDGAEEGDLELVRHPLPAPGREDLVSGAAVRADEVAHVLDHAQGGDVHLVEHRLAADDVGEGHVLGGGHQHRSDRLDLLGERELHVAGSRGEVDDEVVEVAPVHVAEELVDGAMDHGAAPDHRRRVVDEVPDGHRLQPSDVERLDRPPVAALGAVANSQHRWQGRSVDVGVEEPGARSVLDEGAGDVGRHRGLPHPPLARGDQEGVLHAGEQVLHVGADDGQPLGTSHVRAPGHIHRYPGCEVLERAPHVGGDPILEGAGRGGQLHPQGDSIRSNLHVLDHAKRHEIAPDLRIFHGAKGLEDLLLFKRGHWREL